MRMIPGLNEVGRAEVLAVLRVGERVDRETLCDFISPRVSTMEGSDATHEEGWGVFRRDDLGVGLRNCRRLCVLVVDHRTQEVWQQDAQDRIYCEAVALSPGMYAVRVVRYREGVPADRADWQGSHWLLGETAEDAVECLLRELSRVLEEVEAPWPKSARSGLGVAAREGSGA